MKQKSTVKKKVGATFSPMPSASPKLYFSHPDETLTSFFALAQAVEIINQIDGRVRLGLAFNNPAFQKLADVVTWTSLPATSITDAKAKGENVVSLKPSPTRLAAYQKEDNEKDFELQTTKFPNIDPELLKLPAFYYSPAMATLRDAFETFDICPGGRPAALFDYARKPRFLDSPKLGGAAFEILRASSIGSGPFSLVEVGYAGWDGKDTPVDWGNTVLLPEPEALYNDIELLEGYMGLMFSSSCAALGVRSMDYILPAVAAWNRNKNVAWDLRPSQADPGENINQRMAMSYHLPESNSRISIISPMENDPATLIERDLVYAIGYYNRVFSPVITNRQARTLPPRPVPPEGYTYPWLDTQALANDIAAESAS